MDTRERSAAANETVQLWTIQDRAVSRTLRHGSTHVMSWGRVAEADRALFQGMASLMAAAGVSLDGSAPLWAWAGGNMVRSVADGLLSDAQIEAGVDVILFDAPEEVIVCTDYGQWCDAYFGEITVNEWVAADPALPYTVGAQVTLPLIRAEWVREMRSLS